MAPVDCSQLTTEQAAKIDAAIVDPYQAPRTCFALALANAGGLGNDHPILLCQEV
jgi:hypothetical protein